MRPARIDAEPRWCPRSASGRDVLLIMRDLAGHDRGMDPQRPGQIDHGHGVRFRRASLVSQRAGTRVFSAHSSA